jgi:MOSC domain-containing protein YiiM
MSGKVLSLYMTMPDLMRAGHRMEVDSIECDEGGIVGDMNHEVEGKNVILLLCKETYDIIEKNEIVVDEGVLLENIYVDTNINHLNPGSLIEIGETILEVKQACQAYNYLYYLDPELPELIDGKRGLIVEPVDYGRIDLGDEVTILKEA